MSARAEPKLLDRVRRAMRVRHMKWSTEKTYVSWIRRYIFFHGKRHPAEMGAPEIGAFLTHLATKMRVSASTQNQALCALVFLYKHVSTARRTTCEGEPVRATSGGRPRGWIRRTAYSA